ncbi:MAG: DUF4115 domain-containing protein [Cyanobacteria bacterium REEB65]|nr:DUF4115 domain-containing protein [Cyanobacteria bacterium REEB65]
MTVNPTLAEIGAELRQAREAKNLSLEDVAHSTLVQARHLAALEEGRSQDLPEPIYVKNFIRKFAHAVGLSADELANRYWDTRPLPPLPPPPARVAELTVTWWLFPTVIGALMVGAVATLVYLNVRHSAQTAISVPTASPAVATASTPTAATTSSAQLANASRSAVTAPATALEATKPGTTSPVAVKTLSASKSVGVLAQSSSAHPAKAAMTATMAFSSTETLVKGPKIVLQTHTNEAAWMQIVADGRVVQSDVMPQGSTHKWVAARTLLVRIGNPGAVFATLNSQAIGPMGSKDAAVYRHLYLTAAGASEMAKHVSNAHPSKHATAGSGHHHHKLAAHPAKKATRSATATSSSNAAAIPAPVNSAAPNAPAAATTSSQAPH